MILSLYEKREFAFFKFRLYNTNRRGLRGGIGMKKTFFFLVLFFFVLIITVNAKDNGFYHVVRWGDTLMDVSLKYQVDIEELAKVNNISNWNKIYIGQKLWIPKENVENPNMLNVYVYHVKWGDTLGDLAQRYKITIWDIASLNQIYDLNRIYVGQTLYIPVN